MTNNVMKHIQIFIFTEFTWKPFHLQITGTNNRYFENIFSHFDYE